MDRHSKIHVLKPGGVEMIVEDSEVEVLQALNASSNVRFTQTAYYIAILKDVVLWKVLAIAGWNKSICITFCSH